MQTSASRDRLLSWFAKQFHYQGWESQSPTQNIYCLHRLSARTVVEAARLRHRGTAEAAVSTCTEAHVCVLITYHLMLPLTC
jgi:hypothetical protein